MKWYFVFFIIVFFGSCINTQKQNQILENQMHTKLLKAHDSLMNKMDNLVHKREKLNALLVKMRLKKSTEPSWDTLVPAIKIHKAISGLDAVDQSMMNWMQDLDFDYQNESHMQIMQYLQKQFGNERQIDSSMKVALNSADSVSPNVLK